MNTKTSDLLVNVSRLFEKNLNPNKEPDFERLATEYAVGAQPAVLAPPLTSDEIASLRDVLRASIIVNSAKPAAE